MSEKTDEKNVNTMTSNLSSDIKKAGILRKLKTMKKKYFVLRRESETGPARLEYYDSEKKFKSGVPPKRTIAIKTCFNIDRKVDAKHKLVIALYTKDDCFSVVVDNETLFDEWLTAMLELQLDRNCVNGSMKLKPKFEHVWQVTIGEKSLACRKNLKGLYRLCLSSGMLRLVKADQSENPETVEFSLLSIRKCGHINNYFLIELGRSSITGAGELWLETEDVVIAQNMHDVILSAMKSSRELEDLGPRSRPRSASNSENSRPIVSRRPFAVVSPQSVAYGGIRDRCDSMPSRPRTISEGQEINNRNFYPSSNHLLDSLRSHNNYNKIASNSPPGIPNPLSPGSTTDSAGSSLSIDEYDNGLSDFAHGRYAHNLSSDGTVITEPPIKEEQIDDYVPMNRTTVDTTGYLPMAPIYSTSAPTNQSLYLNLNPSDSTRTVSSAQKSEYVEMKSPSSLSEDYIPMAPTNTRVESSEMEINTFVTDDGYTHMAPQCNLPNAFSNTCDGYLDMAPLSSSVPKTSVISNNIDIFHLKENNHQNTLNQSVMSSPEITKLDDFPLDKVKSLLSQTDDTSEDYIRPVRAYSMGSRPQPKKPHISIQQDGSRIRAYSVGSQAATSRNKNIYSADHELGSSLKKIDIRANTKSSSAPLLHNRPPRIRTSASRGNVGEDLMEIDYSKTSHLFGGTDINERDFTIEPVGRSRSGSCSSASASALLSDRKRISELERTSFRQNFIPPTKSIESVATDYIPMSATSKRNTNNHMFYNIDSSKAELNSHLKTHEKIYPDGDYVSLNPSVIYSTYNPNGQINIIKASKNVKNQGSANQPHVVTPAHSKLVNDSVNAAESVEKSNEFHKIENNFSSIDIRNNKIIQHFSPENEKMFCTNSYDTKTTSTLSQAGVSTAMRLPKLKLENTTVSNSAIESQQVKLSTNSLHQKSVHNPESPEEEAKQTLSNEAILEIPCSSPMSPQSKMISVPSSPTLKSSVSKLHKSNCNVPKTPPPSPQSGSVVNVSVFSSAPFMANLTRHLSKPLEGKSIRSAPSSRPASVCCEMQLNYASLDLPPPNEEEAHSSLNRVISVTDAETKEVPLTYAEIDFSHSSNEICPEKSIADTLSHV